MEKPNLNIEWKQEGNKVSFMFKGKEIYFIMPDDYKLSETHPDLIKLSEWLMFSPWYETIGDHKFSRKPGNEFGLSFSTGVDSTAAHLLFPEAKLVYVERHGVTDCIMKQDNAIRMIDFMEKEGTNVIKVKTNFEIIRTAFGFQIGYSTALAMGVPLILLGDYLNLGKVCYGKVFDDQYFTKGIFRGYTKDYIVRQKLFEDCGLIGFYPTVGCSEVITSSIVDNSKYKYHSFSCLRGEDGIQCNNCFKCFRKNLLKKRDAVLDGSSLYSIKKNPPKMASSLLYGLKLNNSHIEELEYLWDLDVSMLNKIYSEAYDIYPKDLKTLAIERLNNFGFKEMTEEEVIKLKSLDFRRNEDIENDLPEP